MEDIKLLDFEKIVINTKEDQVSISLNNNHEILIVDFIKKEEFKIQKKLETLLKQKTITTIKLEEKLNDLLVNVGLKELDYTIKLEEEGSTPTLFILKFNIDNIDYNIIDLKKLGTPSLLSIENIYDIDIIKESFKTTSNNIYIYKNNLIYKYNNKKMQMSTTNIKTGEVNYIGNYIFDLKLEEYSNLDEMYKVSIKMINIVSLNQRVLDLDIPKLEKTFNSEIGIGNNSLGIGFGKGNITKIFSTGNFLVKFDDKENQVMYTNQNVRYDRSNFGISLELESTY